MYRVFSLLIVRYRTLTVKCTYFESYLSIKYLLYFLVVLYLRKEEVPSRGKWELEKFKVLSCV